MTVVGTALLDNAGLTTTQEMRAQKKGPLIVENVMIEIIQVNICVFYVFVLLRVITTNVFFYFCKSLGVLYSQCNGGKIPQRVIIYRATGDDGLFEGKHLLL
jgi:hypothetical protein